MHTNAHRKIPRPFKQYSLISIRAMCKIFTGSGLHMHTVELMLIQESNINKPYLINVKQHNFFLFNHLFKELFNKSLYALYNTIFKPSKKDYKCCSNLTKYPTAL